jgi:hypothetical protein
VRIKYADSGTLGKSLDVTELCQYDRGTISQHQVVSTSSGLKDSFKARVYSLFEANPEITRITLVRANGPIFALMRGPRDVWIDATGRQVVKA